MSEEEIQKLEDQFPTYASSAFMDARARTLAAGLSVLESKEGVIYQTFPDGRREVVKKIDPPTLFVSESVFKIR